MLQKRFQAYLELRNWFIMSEIKFIEYFKDYDIGDPVEEV